METFDFDEIKKDFIIIPDADYTPVIDDYSLAGNLQKGLKASAANIPMSVEEVTPEKIEQITDAATPFGGAIKFTYKLNEVLNALPDKQRFSAKQLEGYLKKKEVSPKEIEQSGILKNVMDDTTPIQAKMWKDNLAASGKNKITDESIPSDKYADITYQREGINTPTYQETLTTIREPKHDAPMLKHFGEDIYNINEGRRNLDSPLVKELTDELDIVETQLEEILDRTDDIGDVTGNMMALVARKKELRKTLKELNPDQQQTLLGWRRTHEQEIDGQNTLILNEFQSDWAQMERSKVGGRSIFRSTKQKLNLLKEKRAVLDAGTEEYKKVNKEIQDLTAKHLGYDEVVADFPMKPDKFAQYEIVASLNDAIKKGIKRVAIPIEREGDLAGNAGVTKFYESLDKSILPGIQKKLEKQGLKLEITSPKPLTPEADLITVGEHLTTWLAQFPETQKLATKIQTSGNLKKDLEDLVGNWPEVLNSKQATASYPFKESFDDVIQKTNKAFELNADAFKFTDDAMVDYEQLPKSMRNKLEDYGVVFEAEDHHTMGFDINYLYRNLPEEIDVQLEDFIAKYRFKNRFTSGASPDRMHILELKEIPNKDVNWDVWAILGTVGTAGYATQEGETYDFDKL